MSDKPPQYFEGILQLREIDQEVYDWVYDTIEREGKCKVAREKALKNGYDLYLSDNHYLQALGKRLKRKFSGELVVSRRLHTQDRMTLKAVYRVTVLFRQHRFKEGDIVKVDNERYKILKVGKRVHTKHLGSGKLKIFEGSVLEHKLH